MRRLITTVNSTSGRRWRILVLGRGRVLRHVPLSLTGSLVHVEEALALLIELLDPARRKLTAGLRWRRSRRRRGLAIGTTRLTIGTGLAIRLLLLRRVLLRRVWLLLVLSICVGRGGRRVLRLIDIARLLGLCTGKGQLLSVNIRGKTKNSLLSVGFESWAGCEGLPSFFLSSSPNISSNSLLSFLKKDIVLFPVVCE
jgi:hypothetical protein